MIKKASFKYQGYLQGGFVFEDNMGSRFNFTKVRNDLIHEYQLKFPISVGQLFHAQYIVFYDPDTEIDTHILSDLKRG